MNKETLEGKMSTPTLVIANVNTLTIEMVKSSGVLVVQKSGRDAVLTEVAELMEKGYVLRHVDGQSFVLEYLGVKRSRVVEK
jgi:hypothetical protein